MKIRNGRYYIAQGFAGLKANSLMSVISVFTVTATLVVFGIFIAGIMNINSLALQIEDQCRINVYVNQELDRDNVRIIGKQLEGIEHVTEVRLFSKEERFEKARVDYKDESEVIDALEEDNPLSDSYILSIDSLDRGTVDQIVSEAAKIVGVEKVVEQEELFKKVLDLTNIVRNVSFWLVALFVIISVMIISNTIRLGLYARRKEINIMKFVGATDWFIRWPFIVEGVLIGIIGAIVASALVLWSYSAAAPGINDFLGELSMLPMGKVSVSVAVSLAALGAGIGAIGSFISIHRYLNEKNTRQHKD